MGDSISQEVAKYFTEFKKFTPYRLSMFAIIKTVLANKIISLCVDRPNGKIFQW